MVKEVKIGSDIFLFDDWECEERWPGAPKPGTKWIRLLLLKNGEKYDWEWNPYIEISWALNDCLYPQFRSFNPNDYNTLVKLKDSIYPFPEQYTKNNDYKKAKQHCDRMLDIINNLMIFI